MPSLVEIEVKVSDLTGPGFASIVAKAKAAQAALNAMSGGQATGTVTGFTAAMAAAAAAGGRFGGVVAGLQAPINLFGGALGKIPFIGLITGMHLAIDLVAEFAAVLIPATIGIAAFGALATPTVQDIVTQMKNLQIVTTATGQGLYPLTGTFQKMANAVKPEVYVLFGDALLIASKKSGAFQQMAVQTGAALDQLGARITMAVTHGNSLSKFLQNAGTDVLGLGNVIGNVFGTIGNVLKVVPGYAQDLLAFAQAVTHVIEVFSNWGPVQFALGSLLTLHGAFLYAGLGVTAFANLMPKMLLGIGNFAANIGIAGGKLDSFGTVGAKAAGALRVFGVDAAGAAMLPWGWIGIAAGLMGVLAYELITAKDAQQQWLAALQQTLAQMPAVKGYNTLLNDQGLVLARLAVANKNLAEAQKGAQAAGKAGMAGLGHETVPLGAVPYAQTQVAELTSGQRQLNDETQLYNYRLSQLKGTYGSTAAASGLLLASGVTMGQMLTKTSYMWAQIRQQVKATSDAYTAMGQTGSTLGADMAVLNTLASDQYTQMLKLNQAWQQYLGLSTGLMGAQNNVITGMNQLRTDAAAAGASFRGVNTASVALRNDWVNLFNTTQQVVGGMRQANASGSDLAKVVATDLRPAINKGALDIAGMRDQIYAMAREAGYGGVNSIAALTAWIDKNATSLFKVTQLTNNFSGALAHIPKGVNVIFTTPGLPGAVANANAFLQAAGHLNGMSVTTYVNTVYSASGSAGPHKASGGIIGAAASGGIRGNSVLVGEYGRELVELPTGSMVRSNPDTERMMSGGSGGTQVSIIAPRGNGVMRALMRDLRIEARKIGGGGPNSAQNTFGHGVAF